MKNWMILGIILGASIAVAHIHNAPPAREVEPQQQDQETESPQEFTVKSDLDLVGLSADSYTASGEPVTVANNLATNSAGGPFATLTELLENLDDRAKADFIETLKREVHVSDADIQRTLDLEASTKVAKAILVNNQRLSDEQARQIVVEKGLATEAQARAMKVVRTPGGVYNSYLNKNKHIVFYEDHRSYVAVMICIMTSDNKAIPAIKTDCGNILKPVKEKEPKPVKIKKPEKAKKPQKGKKQPHPQPQPTPKKPSPTPKKPGVVIIGGGGGGDTYLNPKSDNRSGYVYIKDKPNNNKVDLTKAEKKPPVLEDKDKAQPAPTPTPKEQENINHHNDAVNEAAPLPGGEDAPPNDSQIDEPLNPNSGN